MDIVLPYKQQQKKEKEIEEIEIELGVMVHRGRGIREGKIVGVTLFLFFFNVGLLEIKWGMLLCLLLLLLLLWMCVLEMMGIL